MKVNLYWRVWRILVVTACGPLNWIKQSILQYWYFLQSIYIKWRFLYKKRWRNLHIMNKFVYVSLCYLKLFFMKNIEVVSGNILIIIVSNCLFCILGNSSLPWSFKRLPFHWPSPYHRRTGHMWQGCDSQGKIIPLLSERRLLSR